MPHGVCSTVAFELYIERQQEIEKKAKGYYRPGGNRAPLWLAKEN